MALTEQANFKHANVEQATLWNGAAGRAWVETQALLDQAFEPIQKLLLDAVPAGTACKVLDIGCGTGSTTLAIACHLGADTDCTGCDISEPMLVLARERASRESAAAQFVHADAQLHAFEPGSFDRLVSRFGVMFFDDPVAAFTNLRRAAKTGAVLNFVAWRSAADNPFMTTAEKTAAPLLPELPSRQPGGPGQFAFGDPQRISAILQASGWARIDIQSIDVPCTFPESELRRYLAWLGPVGAQLQKADAQTREAVLDVLRTAFEPYVDGANVRFTAACWLVAAQAGDSPK